MNETLTTTGNYEGALELAKNGYIPVAMLPGTKVPAEKEWQGWPGRPLTEESIARRWKGTRNGIALLCHGLVVLDIDDADKLDLVLEKCGLTRSPICRTPRGGYHVHARARKGMELRRTIKVHGQDIDLLTGPSLSILPPHTNEAGVPYEWLTPGLPRSPSCPWPAWRGRGNASDAASGRAIGRRRRPRGASSPAAGSTSTGSSGPSAARTGTRRPSSPRLKIVRFVGGDPDLAWQLLCVLQRDEMRPGVGRAGAAAQVGRRAGEGAMSHAGIATGRRAIPAVRVSAGRRSPLWRDHP